MYIEQVMRSFCLYSVPVQSVLLMKSAIDFSSVLKVCGFAFAILSEFTVTVQFNCCALANPKQSINRRQEYILVMIMRYYFVQNVVRHFLFRFNRHWLNIKKSIDESDFIRCFTKSCFWILKRIQYNQI